MRRLRPLLSVLFTSLLVGTLAPSASAHAHSPPVAAQEAPRALAVRKELPAPPRGVIDLKFHDLFKMPIGPTGLEASEKLRAADGARVRVVGFMVQQQPAARGGFLLSPLPVAIGDEDEGLADDLPPGLIFVDLTQAADQAIPHMSGLIQISGILRVGAREDAGTQRISFVQLIPDSKTSRALLRVTGKTKAQPRQR